MADSVAIVSVVVTGVASPAIVAAAAWLSGKRDSLVGRQNEYRQVLDDAASELAKVWNSNGQLIALWRRGVAFETDEVLAVRDHCRTANEGMRYAHGRIAIRLGRASEVTRAYAAALDAVGELASARRWYRDGEAIDDHDAFVSGSFDELRASRTRFIDAAFTLTERGNL